MNSTFVGSDGAVGAPVSLSVSDFVALTNQTLEFAYPTVAVTGEVAEFRVSQGKWVSFKLKDSGALVNCFLTAFNLRQPIENGMKITVVAAPRLNNKGYFTLNVRTLKLVGEGSIKKGFELLKEKLEKEGLFSPERKRPLPSVPRRVAVVTSSESAAYADFCKIINDRWGGLSVLVGHTQVQGAPAADQMIRAIKYFNEMEDLPEVLVILRGGGSVEDLSAFNDEALARTIAGSRIPTLVGVGHEIDHTLADMVSDVRAATPTNAAEILVPDKMSIVSSLRQRVVSAGGRVQQSILDNSEKVRLGLLGALKVVEQRHVDYSDELNGKKLVLRSIDPNEVLRRGYALVRGSHSTGSDIEIELRDKILKAEVKDVREK